MLDSMEAETTIARIKPAGLRRGDTIGIVAPSSNLQRAALEAGRRSLEQAGYGVFYLDSIFEQDLYFAGAVKRRVDELHAMFRDPHVRAILCARGGYGANYLLPHLDLELMRRNPKVFAGYSDVTCLLTYLSDAAGFVTFHAPMAASDFAHETSVDEQSWNAVFAGDVPLVLGEESGISGLADGSAEGILYGGCLSILVASLGTPYQIRTAGTILFVEDVATKPFQIDRMLMQLKLAGKLDGVRGVVFGEMLDCIQPAGQSYTLQQVVSRVLGDCNIPVAYGLRSGHVSRRNIALPIGVRARLEVSGKDASLSIIEAAVKT